MSHYTPLFSKIVDSSIWCESDVVVKVFLTLLAKKERGGVVIASAFMIAQWAKKTEGEVIEALKVLSSPDTKRLEPQPFDGRRIEKVEGGWRILNAEYYQGLMMDANRRVKNAEAQARFRERQKAGNEAPVAREVAPKTWSPTPEQIRLGAIFKRRPSTPWEPEQLREWRKVTPIADEDLTKLERYYRYRGAGEKEMWKKTNFDRFIRDITVQIEKARAWREPSSV